MRLLASANTETGIRIELKSPSGLEWPGPEHSLLTGTGSTNLSLHVLEVAHLLPAIRIDIEAGYVAKLPAIVGYVTEVDGYGHGWIDPGDEVQAVPHASCPDDGGLDLTADLGESNDLAKAHPKKVEELLVDVFSMRAELGDRLTGQAGSQRRSPGRVPTER